MKPAQVPFGFDETFYLQRHLDVQSAVSKGLFSSGLHHYTTYGQAEGRAAQFMGLGSDEGPLSPQEMSDYRQGGFVVLKQLFSAEAVAALNGAVDQAWQERQSGALVVDILSGAQAGKRVHLKSMQDSDRQEVYKLNDLFLANQEVCAWLTDQRLNRVLQQLLEGDPIVCNSLNFERGSQQPAHFDTWYMPPQVLGKMAVASIALEDVQVDAGPVFYYPMSHLLAPYRFSHGGLSAVEAEMEACNHYVTQQVARHHLKPVTNTIQAGDVFIWHGQLLHGGSPIHNRALTRKSLVTHYWRRQDVNPELVGELGPQRFYIKRPHQAVA